MFWEVGDVQFPEFFTAVFPHFSGTVHQASSHLLLFRHQLCAALREAGREGRPPGVVHLCSSSACPQMMGFFSHTVSFSERFQWGACCPVNVYPDSELLITFHVLAASLSSAVLLGE